MSLATAAATQTAFPQIDPGTFRLSPPRAPDAVRGTVACDLAMRHAGRRRLQVRYELVGAVHAPVVLVAGGISADRHVATSATFPEKGWWDQQVGPGRALEPSRYRILSIDWLGADGTLDAPIDAADQADAIAAVLDALGIGQLTAFIGSSYGAMVGLQFAARHDTRIVQLVAISGAHRAHPFSSAWRALQRQAVALGALQCDESHGLALARQLAILSYRTPEEFAERFAPAEVVNGRVRVGAEDYLEHCSAKYVARTPPVAFLRLSESIDLHDVEPEKIRVPVTVVAIAGDRLVPVDDAYRLVERLRGESRLQLLHSRYGHDAFLKETAAIAAVLRTALGERTGGAA